MDIHDLPGRIGGELLDIDSHPVLKLLFDETVTEHLDIESIVFLSERLRQLLCGATPDRRP